MGRRRVAKHVRADLLGCERRHVLSGLRRATLDYLANAGAGDRAPEPVQEDGLGGGAPLGQICERSGRALQQRAQACLAALPPQNDERMAQGLPIVRRSANTAALRERSQPRAKVGGRIATAAIFEPPPPVRILDRSAKNYEFGAIDRLVG